MNYLEEFSQENKDDIEMVMNYLGQGCELLATTVGQFNFVFNFILQSLAKLFGDPNSKEAKYFAEQFKRVNEKLERIQDELKKKELVQQRSKLNIGNFKPEANINNQYEMFKKIVTAESEFKDRKKMTFLKHFEETEGENSLNWLYGEITGKHISVEAMLDTILATEQRSRRAVEEFCVRLKKLFVVGIIALMGYTALKEGAVGKDIVQKWQRQMEEVEKRMKAAVDECVDNFAVQAKTDLDQELKKTQSRVDPEFAKFLLDTLVKKYDWVSWSVRVFNFGGNKFWQYLCQKRYHISGKAANYFEYFQDKEIKIVVSFTMDPKSLNKSQIRDQIEKKKGNVKCVAESLSHSLPNCIVHAIHPTKRVEEANNFDPEHFYNIYHKIAHIYIHSE